ncbi:MAG: hypothetical protein JO247_14420, partial [Chloroflexi bacterium]|nr:hypothetical protein [Chloroflexota bacterium]
MAEPLTIDCYFDCACRWAWWTSVWLRRVARAGQVTVTWRLLSLAVQDHPENYAELVRPDHARHIKDF